MRKGNVMGYGMYGAYFVGPLAHIRVNLIVESWWREEPFASQIPSINKFCLLGCDMKAFEEASGTTLTCPSVSTKLIL